MPKQSLMNESIKIYFNWLKIPKSQFKLLMFLLDKEKKDFSLEDILDYLDIDESSTNVANLYTSFEYLANEEWIDLSIDKDKKTISASIVEKDMDNIEIKKTHIKIDDFRRKGFSQSVDWGTALKVLFAIMFIGCDFTRKDIMAITDVGSGAIGRTIKVLRCDFSTIDYKVNRKKFDFGWITFGIHLDIGAFGITRK